MPTYDFRCNHGCGHFEDVFVLLSELDTVVCPSCDQDMTRLVRSVATVGPMPSKPLVVNQVGRTFHSRADWNKYQRANPDVEILSASSQAWRNHRDTAQGKAEAKARQRGFRDLEDYRNHRKKVKTQTV
jgi:putative FmdB family regulatory protein